MLYWSQEKNTSKFTFHGCGKKGGIYLRCSELKKKFRETSLHLVVLNALISRNICDNQVRTHGMHAVQNVTWKNEKLSPIIENISSNQLFSNFFNKNVTFTKFLSKMGETKSQQFPHCVTEKPLCLVKMFFSGFFFPKNFKIVL